jgi:hypothetical protein
LLDWISLLGDLRLRKSLELTWSSVGPAKFSEIGKFGFKEEPGKIRVFAMVDYLTQVALKPLHKVIFKVLSPIRQDGTFDQEAPLRRLVSRYGGKRM